MLEINAFKFCPRCKHVLLKNRKESYLVCKNCKTHYHCNPHPTSAAIIVNPQGQILLTRRAHPPKKGWWDLPGGFAKPLESIEACLVRELKEELGITVRHYRYLGSYFSLYPYRGLTYVTLCFAFVVSYKGKINSVMDDIDEMRFLDPQEIDVRKLAMKDVQEALSDYLKKLSLDK